MKKLFLAFLLIASNSFADTDKSITNSDIKEVKVFLSGAMIYRKFSATVDEGVTRLIVENLSSQINRNSISANVTGDAMILSTSFSMDYMKEERVTPKLKMLKDSLEKLNYENGDLNILKSVYNEEVGMLNANKAIGGSNVGVNFENLQKIMDYYRQRMLELKNKMMEIDKKQVKLAEHMKRIGQQLEEENGKVNRPYGTIFINVSAKQKSTLNFELSYFAHGASWKPTYDLRAKDVNSPVSMMYKAIVTQSTGENWDKVHLSLSTGNPTIGGVKPTLNPWYLRFMIERHKQLGYAPAVEGDKEIQMETISATRAGAYAKDESNTIVDSISVQENQIVTEFDIQLPYSVLSDGKEVLMDIQSHSLPATYSYYGTPKLDKDAFLMASITGWEKLNLLPGPSNIYFENSYVGQSYINPYVTTDTLLLSFGRDKRIIIDRDIVKDKNTSKYIGGNIEKEFMFETSIRNTKKENITLTIEDQVPLTTDQSIKISDVEVSGGNYNAETGMVNWKVDVKAGETTKIRFGFKVKYPKDKVIPGL